MDEPHQGMLVSIGFPLSIDYLFKPIDITYGVCNYYHLSVYVFP